MPRVFVVAGWKPRWPRLRVFGEKRQQQEEEQDSTRSSRGRCRSLECLEDNLMHSLPRSYTTAFVSRINVGYELLRHIIRTPSLHRSLEERSRWLGVWGSQASEKHLTGRMRARSYVWGRIRDQAQEESPKNGCGPLFFLFFAGGADSVSGPVTAFGSSFLLR